MTNKDALERDSLLQQEIRSYHTDLHQARQVIANLPQKASSRILYVPGDLPTISAAVHAAKPGDTILVSSGQYQEAVTIPSDKASIRILGEGHVILNGAEHLPSAFIIKGNHIEINGFTIRNYVQSGIKISGAFGCRLVSNHIERTTLGNGIRMVVGSFSNLIWKNRVTNCYLDAINLRGKNNYIVGNDLSDNRRLGILLRALGNYVIHNRISNNGRDGIIDHTGLNLIFNNDVTHNGSNGVHETGGLGGAAIPSNRITNNFLNGIQLDTRDTMILGNSISNNRMSGVFTNGRRNVLQNNTISTNDDSGVTLTKSGNLLLQNDLQGNSPFDIVNLNHRNSFMENRCETSLPYGLCHSDRGSFHNVLEVPQQFSSIAAAVEAATPGSTILVKDGIYRETVSIPAAKSSIRLIADGNEVVLDGQGVLNTGFTILANNVEIQGFRISNYVTAGIHNSGISNKLLQNTIVLITQGNGITLNRAFSTLIWQNHISRASQNGISILAMNTWCLENEISQNGANGVLTTGVSTVGNTITGNRIYSNGLDGIADSAGFNLLLNNNISHNKGNGIHEISGAGYASILRNHLTHNFVHGLELTNDGNFASHNLIRENQISNIHITGQFNVLENNLIGQNTFQLHD